MTPTNSLFLPPLPDRNVNASIAIVLAVIVLTVVICILRSSLIWLVFFSF